MREPVEELFPWHSRATYRFLKRLSRPTLRAAFDINVEGLDNVPTTGPAIIAANHISFIDSVIVPWAIPRRVVYMAKAEYWESAKTRWFFNATGMIPVHRMNSAKAAAALEAGEKVLSRGGLLGIYPEGTRSRDGKLHKGRTGVARMAQAAGCPVIPTGLIGTDRAMPTDRKLPKLGTDMTIRFGAPMYVPSSDGDPLAARSFVDSLMFAIMQLSGQEYVDAYADRKPKPATEPARA